MLYICIPVYNEAPTIGLLLWKIHKIFQEYQREYELLVYNDGSTDATAETIAGYQAVLPLTVLGGTERVGYANALAELFRTASSRTKYARRDAVLTLQGDFTDSPELIPEFVKRFEGGADIVVGEWSPPTAPSTIPKEVHRLRRFAPWVLKPFLRIPGVQDPLSTFRLYRVSVIRDALKALGQTPLVGAAGWASNVDALLSLIPHARRTEVVAAVPRFDLRPRATRVRPLADVMALFHYSRRARSRNPREVPAQQ